MVGEAGNEAKASLGSDSKSNKDGPDAFWLRWTNP